MNTNNAQIINDAIALGLNVETPVTDRLRITSSKGGPGNVIKAFAAQGLDVVRDPRDLAMHRVQTWIVTTGATIGNDVVAIIDHDTTTGFTYGRTCKV